MVSSKKIARVGAAGFALGLYLSAPGLAVAGAETGSDDGAAVSANSADQPTKATKAPAKGREATAAARSSRVPQRAGASQPGASAEATSGLADAAVRRTAQLSAAVPRSAAARSSKQSPHAAPEGLLSEQSESRPATISGVESVEGRVVARPAAKAPTPPYPASPADSTAAATVVTGIGSGESTAVPILSATIAPGADTSDELTSLAALNSGVVNWFDSVNHWLSGLPANPVSDFVAGGLLLLRRNLFNQLPTADPVQLVTNGAGQVEGSIQAVDPEGDLLTYSLVGAPEFGTVQLSADGSFIYTPDFPDSPGQAIDYSDQFTVAVSDRGFNVLDPFSSRTVLVQELIDPAGPLVGASQGFDIVNLTNSMVWLTGADWDSSEWKRESCSTQNFCTDKLIGTVLKPGDTFHVEIETSFFDNININGRDTKDLWLDFAAPELEASGLIRPTWRIHVGAQYKDLKNYIGQCTGSGANNCGYTNPIRSNPDGPGYVTLPRQLAEAPIGIVSYPNESQRTLLLVGSYSAGFEAGQVYNINADSTWETAPPAWCSTCKPGPELNAQDVFKNMLAVTQRISPDPKATYTNGAPRASFVPKYLNVVYSPIAQYRPPDTFTNASGGAPVAPASLDNPTGARGNTLTINWEAKSDPGPQPSAPWWLKYATEGGSALAKFVLDKFVSADISQSISSAIGQVGDLFTPQQIKAGTTYTGQQLITALPYSVNAILVAPPKLIASGNVTLSLGKCQRGGNSNGGDQSACGSAVSGNSGPSAWEDPLVAFSFSGMNFEIVDRRASYQSTVRSEPIQPKDNSGNPIPNVGFLMIDKASQSRTPSYAVGTVSELYLSAFNGADDFSARACSEKVSVNCTSFSVDRPGLAELAIKDGYAYLTAKAPGTVRVTAEYRWAIPTGGDGITLPAAREDSVVAILEASITGN